MILAIVVYFKAEWEFQFDPQKTRGMLFHLSLSQRYDVPMMFLTARLPYYETDDFQLVELAFAGCDLSMVLLVPRRSDGLSDLETQLSPERLLSWQKAAQPCLVSLDLPRFDQTSSLQLCPSLRKMGMIDAFDDRLADFSGIDNFKWLFISGCWHKTFLSVDEKGCESSAAAQDTPMASSGAEAPVAVRADHPFLFFIRENNSGSLLFLGRLVEP
jgi:serpin B